MGSNLDRWSVHYGTFILDDVVGDIDMVVGLGRDIHRRHEMEDTILIYLDLLYLVGAKEIAHGGMNATDRQRKTHFKFGCLVDVLQVNLRVTTC